MHKYNTTLSVHAKLLNLEDLSLKGIRKSTTISTWLRHITANISDASHDKICDRIKGMNHMSEILTLTYKLKEVTNLCVLQPAV